MAIKDLKIDEVLEDLRDEASKRAAKLLGEGRTQARRAVGAHDDTALFSAFTAGILLGAVVGAALALLLAPFPGTEARRRLGERAAKMRSGSDDHVAQWERTGDGTPAYPSATTAER